MRSAGRQVRGERREWKSVSKKMGGWWGAEDWKTEKPFFAFGEDREDGG